MKVVMRADASVAVGTGHVMRCLALADALRDQGAEVLFICRELPGNLCDFIAGTGFPVYRLPAGDRFVAEEDARRSALLIAGKPEWLVVDHYGIGATWERIMRPRVMRIMVIDDLADRPHDCDLLLDQNLFEEMEGRYRPLVPAACRLLLGPRYALLRREFVTARAALRRRYGTVRRLLVFFGGSDPTGETEKALQALARLDLPEVAIDVVVGGANPRAADIERRCRSLSRVTFLHQVSNMAQLMALADLALGAGGSATWERCFLGLPALIIVVAENQARPARDAERAGLAMLLGESREVTAESLAASLRQALERPLALRRISERCLEFMGTRGTPINDELLQALNEVPYEP